MMSSISNEQSELNHHQCDFDDDDGSNEIRLREREWERLKSRFEASGYKEGISNAREASLQDGFNDGFFIGANSGFSIGHLKGIVRALRVIIMKQQHTDSSPTSPLVLFPLQIATSSGDSANPAEKTEFASAEELLAELDNVHQQLSNLVFRSKAEIASWQHILDKESHQLKCGAGENTDFSSLGHSGARCVLRIIAISDALGLSQQRRSAE